MGVSLFLNILIPWIWNRLCSLATPELASPTFFPGATSWLSRLAAQPPEDQHINSPSCQVHTRRVQFGVQIHYWSGICHQKHHNQWKGRTHINFQQRSTRLNSQSGTKSSWLRVTIPLSGDQGADLGHCWAGALQGHHQCVRLKLTVVFVVLLQLL
jgi:hypothetical protein